MNAPIASDAPADGAASPTPIASTKPFAQGPPRWITGHSPARQRPDAIGRRPHGLGWRVDPAEI
jgi:hypothetical protein